MSEGLSGDLNFRVGDEAPVSPPRTNSRFGFVCIPFADERFPAIVIASIPVKFRWGGGGLDSVTAFEEGSVRFRVRLSQK